MNAGPVTRCIAPLQLKYHMTVVSRIIDIFLTRDALLYLYTECKSCVNVLAFVCMLDFVCVCNDNVCRCGASHFVLTTQNIISSDDGVLCLRYNSII